MVISGTTNPKKYLFRSNKSLRNDALNVAWSKMISVLGYISLFFLVKLNTLGVMSVIIQIITMVAMLLNIFQVGILCFGAFQESHYAVTISMFLCIFGAANDLVLGIVVGIYFMIIGREIVDYIICLAYSLLAISFFSTIFHDVLIINKYRKSLIEIYGFYR